jgi:deazaflavin-dependent oxidoreductase (nitroreductase family)
VKLDPATLRLLRSTNTVDITTTGRRSGRPHRVEIWMFEVDGQFIITGTPGPRSWLANLLADPRLTVHLPEGREVIATATPVTDETLRHRVFTAEATWWYRSQTPLEDLIASSPMVALTFGSPD